ncbi:MAG TPA: glycoside hydrolase family 27 protein [Terriglobia bacterium]|nr:glycoside hydrolase family 27 protein [Terriglobia bacterium]
MQLNKQRETIVYNRRVIRIAWMPLMFAIMCWKPLGCFAQDPLAKTPPMGWNSWNHFGCKITDSIVRAQADAMVSSGMKAAGYEYVNIDDCWEGRRDSQGFIHPNSKFPDMKSLAEYVHSKGLKLGIYSSPGPKTCAGYEGSYGHEQQDAETYAKWGIDYLKYDWCSARYVYQPEQFPAAFEKMHQALLSTGRPIVYSIHGRGRVWAWARSVGANLWRTTGDIKDDYNRMIAIGFGQSGLAQFAGPGHWNDPDMLEIGNGGMTAGEYRTHMSLWCLLAAPLITGNDLTRMSAETLAILTNPEVIAIDQDPLGVEGHRVWEEGPLEIWIKPLADGSKAVGLFNREQSTIRITVKFSDIGIGERATVRDLWARRDLGTFTGSYSADVEHHGVVLIKVTSTE